MVKKAFARKIDIDCRLVKKARFGIIRALFNEELTKNLLDYCWETLRENGVVERQIDIVEVPGSLEIPLAAQRMAQTGKFDVLIALGVIIKGDTYHFELVANQCSHGCMQVALTYNIPVIFEVLAVYNQNQAEKRAGKNDYNKGIEAALAALRMLKIRY